MLNSAFDEWANASADYYVTAHREEIAAINRDVYSNVNNGVYRCGVAAFPEAYDDACDKLFDALERLKARLASQRVLTGNIQTEAD